ncbi:hypothetical protein ACTXT7_016929 [Hymenolepis weldensis]
MAACLAASANGWNLEELAELANKIQELTNRTRIHAAKTPAPNPVTIQQPYVLTNLLEELELLGSSTASQHDLNMAESLDPNCKQTSTTANSGTEFNTKFSETDIRELSQKLPGLADDSNTVQEDVHKILSEDTTASCKA